jgi:hypothetical protein
MTNQKNINTGQTTINDRQGSVNKRQSVINNDQNTINEQTKIDLSVRNFWAIIMLVVTVTSVYLWNNFRIASDISNIDTNIAFIKDGLNKHLEESKALSKEMTQNVANRDKEINKINETLATVKTILKIN